MAERIVGAQPLLARLIAIIDARPQRDNPAFGLQVVGNAMFAATTVSYPDEPARQIAVQLRDVETLVQDGALQRTPTKDGWQVRLNLHLLHR